VHDGKVIAERYAGGVGVDTPLLGFSMTKSVINALIGILTQQGLVTPSMPAPIPEWRGTEDPRREIEIDYLKSQRALEHSDPVVGDIEPSLVAVVLERVRQQVSGRTQSADNDVAAQPLLFNWKDGTPAVAINTKMGHLFVLNRFTGVSLLPVEERAVPQT
jgi:hypothetical protein